MSLSPFQCQETQEENTKRVQQLFLILEVQAAKLFAVFKAAPQLNQLVGGHPFVVAPRKLYVT